jgi:YfiH family protein
MGRGVVAVMTARAGGGSPLPWASCNLGDHVGDDLGRVLANRQVLARCLPAEPVFMSQVHGEKVIRLNAQILANAVPRIEADGALTTEPGMACVVMVADCLPILLAAPEGRGVAALHAGWRGLAGCGSECPTGDGIVVGGVHALCEATGCDPGDLRAWLGPCIGPQAFEVGADVLAGFGVSDLCAATPHFVPRGGHPGKWLANLSGLAGDKLRAVGVRNLSGEGWCTVSDAGRFFSHRRDGVSGRQAAAICLTPV